MKVDSIKTPHLGCLHPVKLNRDGVFQLVPCGKCAACQIARSNVLTQTCHLEDTSSRYCMFVTLTYAECYVPRFHICSLNYEEKRFIEENSAFFEIDKVFVLSRQKALKTDEQDRLEGVAYVYNSVSYETVEFFMRKQLVKDDDDLTLRLLYKPDVQRFIKRVNYYYNYGRKEKIKLRYFVAGEYGPTTLRPHYHLLFWFDSYTLAEQLCSIVRKAWPFGRIDCQFSQGGSSVYTAGYLNSFACLPSEFRSLRKSRPFCSKSLGLGFGFFRSAKSSVYVYKETNDKELDIPFLRFWKHAPISAPYRITAFDGIQFPKDGQYTETFFYRYIKDWFFPRTLRFASEDRRTYKENLCVFDTLCRYYGEDPKSVCLAGLARHVFLRIYEEWDSISYLLRRPIRGESSNEVFHRVYWDSSFGEIAHLTNIVASLDDSSIREVYQNQRYFEQWLNTEHQCFRKESLQVVTRSNGDNFMNHILRYLSVSRHFLRDILEFDYSKLDIYVDIITSYYARSEYEYYRQVKEMSECTSFSRNFLKQMYPDTYNAIEMSETPEYYWYNNNIVIRVGNRLKHKEMNDSMNLLIN